MTNAHEFSIFAEVIIYGKLSRAIDCNAFMEGLYVVFCACQFQGGLTVIHHEQPLPQLS